MNGKKKTDGKKVGVTIRLELELAPPTDDKTNEFSYVHLLKDRESQAGVGSAQSLQQGSPSLPDPLGSDNSDENLAAIAKRFEEKYGPKKRKRVLHESDLIDRGLGYDQADSFVDDSEVYENYVPHQLDTRFGGFYINTGMLEFKPADDPEINDELDFIVSKKPKKPRVKKLGSFQTTPQAILASQKLKKAKQRVALQKNPASKKAAQGSIAGSTPPPAKKQKQSEPKNILPRNSATGVGSLSQPGSQLCAERQVLVTSSVDGSTQHTVHNIVSQSSELQPAASTVPGAVVDAKSSEMELGEGQMIQLPKEPPVLPDQLPPAALVKVTNLEQLILQDTDTNGRLPIKARITYDERLVDIHFECFKLPKKSRNAVFDYLAYKMGVARGTLIKRINQELKKREDTELDKCIANLKKAVDETMPGQVLLYTENLARSRTASISETEEESKVDDVIDESTNASATGSNQPAGSQELKIKRPPRKRFRWTEDVRKLLIVVVKEKVQETLSKGNKINNWEEIIGTFLDEKIKPLWPRGWMQKSILYKTSEVAHKQFTNPLSKKAVLLKKDKPASPTLAKKDQPLSTLIKAMIPPGQATASATASSLLALPKTTAATNKKTVDLGSIKVLSAGGTLLAGAAKTGNISAMFLGAPKPASATQKAVQPSQIHAGNTKALPSLQAKPGQANSASVVTAKSTNNRRTAPAKSTEASKDSNALTTYLLSAGTRGIAELLQAHISQKGGSIKIVPSTSGTSSKGHSSQGIQLIASGISAAEPRKHVTLTPSSPAASKSVTSMSVSHMSKVTPAVISVGSGRPVTGPGAKVTRPGGEGSAKTGNTILPCHLLSTVEMEKGRLVNTSVSRFNSQSPLLVPPLATNAQPLSVVSPLNTQSSLVASPLHAHPSAVSSPLNTHPSFPLNAQAVTSSAVVQSPSAPNAPRLNLKKKAFASPQIILPGHGEPMKSHAPASPTTGNLVELTRSSTQSKLINTFPHSVGLSSALPTEAASQSTTAGVHKGATPTPPLGHAVPKSVGVIVIPDTPPQNLSMTSVSSQHQTATPLSPELESPLKSPMEQIIGEHSYPAPSVEPDI